ncbi:MAG: hypothetical protein ABSF18_06720 [Gammaproteobacteria bacterium]
MFNLQKFEDIQSNSMTDNPEQRFRTFRHGEWVKFGAYSAEPQANQPRRHIPEQEYGWKMHIGIDDATPGNLKLGWETILPILQAKGIKLGKIVNINSTRYTPYANNNPKQCGKQMTIYCFKQGNVVEMEQFWRECFTEITHALRANNVRCAPLSPSDMPVPGSEYISYRNDSDGMGGYYDGQYNAQIHGANPFQNIVVNAPGQTLQRPAYPIEVRQDSGSSSYKFNI